MFYFSKNWNWLLVAVPQLILVVHYEIFYINPTISLVHGIKGCFEKITSCIGLKRNWEKNAESTERLLTRNFDQYVFSHTTKILTVLILIISKKHLRC